MRASYEDSLIQDRYGIPNFKAGGDDLGSSVGAWATGFSKLVQLRSAEFLLRHHILLTTILRDSIAQIMPH